MNWQNVVWIYIGFLVAGGVIGFVKARSRVSLITAVVASALLALAALGHLPFVAAPVLLGLLTIVFAIRLAKTKKVMPSGILAAATVVTLIAVLILRPR